MKNKATIVIVAAEEKWIATGRSMHEMSNSRYNQALVASGIVIKGPKQIGVRISHEAQMSITKRPDT